jgi:hypothetical protein
VARKKLVPPKRGPNRLPDHFAPLQLHSVTDRLLSYAEMGAAFCGGGCYVVVYELGATETYFTCARAVHAVAVDGERHVDPSGRRRLTRV